ncbi:MAG: (deoxy)nucleoside triphosphate pyrophosphohydrolase [Alphaproteobacteria bacterium]|nr:(deoxy)nucleoside triphosphate pyrophosphohydrolase [Alphaproteobacteria bacterium]
MNCRDALKQPPPETTPDLPTLLVSAAALVDESGRVLIAQRPKGKPMAGLWEFPGGKVKTGETPEFALMRELREELGIETRPCCFHPVAFASHSYTDFHLLMPLFACRVWEGVPAAKEHTDLAWVKPQDILAYPMPAADIPLVGTLMDVL